MSTGAGRGQHGGSRQPQNPAAVSNPQSGARTDGGPGSRTQPIRVAPGGAYGERQATVAQQQGAPLAAGGGPPQPGGMVAGNGQAPSVAGLPLGGVFGPSQGNSPLGVPPVTDPGQMMAEDPQLFLRVLADKFPHPAIRRLVDWSAAGNMAPRGSQMDDPRRPGHMTATGTTTTGVGGPQSSANYPESEDEGYLTPKGGGVQGSSSRSVRPEPIMSLHGEPGVTGDADFLAGAYED